MQLIARVHLLRIFVDEINCCRSDDSQDAVYCFACKTLNPKTSNFKQLKQFVFFHLGVGATFSPKSKCGQAMWLFQIFFIA